MPEFIFMLTKDDQTIADALSVYDEVRGAPLRYVGFKDIGQPAPVLRELTGRIRADGRTAVLEVVSIDRDSEVRSIQTASNKPAAPPTAASSRLSTSNCDTILRRPAPRANRTAISFWRAVARATRRFATLAQAISSTPATTAISTRSGVENPSRKLARPCDPGIASMVARKNCSLVYGDALAKAASFTSISSIW